MRACHESPAGVSPALAVLGAEIPTGIDSCTVWGGGGQTVEESIFLLGTGGVFWGIDSSLVRSVVCLQGLILHHHPHHPHHHHHHHSPHYLSHLGAHHPPQAVIPSPQLSSTHVAQVMMEGISISSISSTDDVRRSLCAELEHRDGIKAIPYTVLVFTYPVAPGRPGSEVSE